jgi:putative ABC transport system ATP-binding protein
VDTVTGDNILDIFDDLHDRGITLIFVTHDPEVAERAERTVLLRDGLIESDKSNGRKMEIVT